MERGEDETARERLCLLWLMPLPERAGFESH